jgi:[ribosomal protein S5]-alanine N-acetyltransferase
MSGIKTTRLTLRKLQDSDNADLKNNISREVIRWLPSIPFPYDLDCAKEYINYSKKNFKNKKAFDFGIIFKEKLIGTISLSKINFKLKEARLSYLLNKKFWSMGIMSEAVGCILKYGFEHLKLNRIYTGIILENKASYKILIKYRFKKVGINRNYYFIRKMYYDEIIMALDFKDFKEAIK